MLYVHVIIESGNVILTRSTKLEIKEKKQKKIPEIKSHKLKPTKCTACGEKDARDSSHITSFNLKGMYTLTYSRMHDPGGIL